MRVVFGALLFCLPLFAQTPILKTAPPPQHAPAATQPARVANSDIGFVYNLPSDWNSAPPPTTPAVIVPYPNAIPAPKGDACARVAMTARHAASDAAVVVTALPFACYGQILRSSDLKDFSAGGADGLKQTCDLADPVQGNYSLGNHAFWSERVKGTPKGHPNKPFIIETTCTILAKGAVCWTAMAKDTASLQTFEAAPVTLEGESFPALIPANTFPPNP